MKKTLMTIIALLTITAAVAQSENQQRRAPRQVTPEEQTTRMAKDLNLTDDQKAKLLKLNTEYKDVLAAPGMRRGPRPGGKVKPGEKPQTDADTQATPQQAGKPQHTGRGPQLTDEQKAQLKQQQEKRKAYDTQLKQILTDDQYKAYQQHHQRRGGHGGRGGHRGPRPQGGQE